MAACALAVAFAIGGYALLLAIRKGPPPAGEPVVLSAFPVLTEPSRLPRRPSFTPADSAMRDRTVSLAIEVLDLPDLLLPTAGVAVFDQGTDAQLCWLPLVAAARTDQRLTIQAIVPTGRPLRVTAAPDDLAARHGYWLQTALPADRATDAAVILRVPAQRLTVHVLRVPVDPGVMQLRRHDDPGWRPLDAGALVPDTQGDLQLVLGPGEYDLVPWKPGPWQQDVFVIRVPGPAEVTAMFVPPPAPGGPP